MLIYDELPTAFPWYNRKDKQQRYSENAIASNEYNLISPMDALLPFQVKLNFPSPPVESWFIFNACDDTVAFDLGIYMSSIKARDTANGMYIYYEGEQLTDGFSVLQMPSGCYYSRISFGGLDHYFSEVFQIKDKAFTVAGINKFIKLEYWNSCDIPPLMYITNLALQTNFKQIIYLDTYIHASEPEIEEEGERDDNDQLIPTFQKMSIKYRFSVLVPNYLKIALVSMQIHDNIYLTTEGNVRTGRIESMTTSSTIENDGYYSTVEVVMEQLVMVKKACCDNMPVVNENPWG